jgi:hypothetical protein
MGGEGVVALAAVTLFFAVPIGAMYTYYRVRQLRTQERLAAIEHGISVPMAPEQPQPLRSRRMALLFICGSIGYIAAFGLVARLAQEPDAWTAAAFGAIPLAIGAAYLIDWVWTRGEVRA